MLERSQALRATAAKPALVADSRRGTTGAFSAELEAEFGRLQLAENRTLIRVVSLVALLLAALRGADQILLGSWTPFQLGVFGVVLAASTLLAVIAWSPWFQRIYLPCAQVLIPLRGSLIAFMVAGVASRGQVESLMLLPLLMVGPFLVFGLRFRTAVFTVTLTITVFATAAAIFGLPPAAIVRACLLLIVVAGACGVVARTLERSARARFIETHAMAELAEKDPLTGVKNRRVFDEHLETFWQRAIKEERGIAILLIDVDHFKAYNDRYGHQAGDRALRRVAEMLQMFVTRPNDLLARYGGEEFAVLLYDVDGVAAERVAAQMRKAVCAMGLEHRDSRLGQIVTISIGVGVVEPSPERRARGALQLADEALYQAKTMGRNRVEVLDPAAHKALETGVFVKGSGLG
ncbi:MAG TPA: GGDEF domain-containing protein [Gammaproteobacteria bacterium]|nr:GGDEF domain-containing protein [Gammaproteobacteria bacterium]